MRKDFFFTKKEDYMDFKETSETSYITKQNSSSNKSRNKKFSKILNCIIILLLIFVNSIIFSGCASHTITEEYQLIRIHIRANSNGEKDQGVKLLVRDEITSYLETELKDVTDVTNAHEMISKRLTALMKIADAVLEKNGFTYKSKAKLNEEFFPTRSYEDIVVESGYYDALIIELGSGEGDNWWCVIYPPLCYLEAEANEGFSYKSKISEIFEKYFGKK